jgi:hypothetical protein
VCSSGSSGRSSYSSSQQSPHGRVDSSSLCRSNCTKTRATLLCSVSVSALRHDLCLHHCRINPCLPLFWPYNPQVCHCSGHITHRSCQKACWSRPREWQQPATHHTVTPT